MPWEPLASADLEVGTCDLFIPLQASVSVKRLGNFLRNTELNPKMIDWVPVRESKLLMLCGADPWWFILSIFPGEEDDVIKIKDASFSWDSEKQEIPTLSE